MNNDFTQVWHPTSRQVWYIYVLYISIFFCHHRELNYTNKGIMKSKVPKKQHADVVFISVICFHNKKNIAIIFHHSPWSDLRSLDAQICIPFPGSGPCSSLDFRPLLPARLEWLQTSRPPSPITSSETFWYLCSHFHISPNRSPRGLK